jgi:hypothetical protein
MSIVYFNIQKRQNSGKDCDYERILVLTLEGRLFVANRMTEIKEVTTEDTDASYSKRLEKALIELCRQLDVPVPMWMKKNTKEFAAFGQTIFFREQHTDNVRFDRFQIRVIEG